jgi:hypothetical protein
MTGEVAEAVDVDGAYLLNEHTSGRSMDVDLGPKRRRVGAGRRGGHQHDRAWEKGIGLHEDAEATPSLFVSHTLRKS